MTAAPAEVVSARGVTRRFDSGTQALAPVDLTLAAGELVALLGPSGCGKTTLLNLFAGLDQPSAGAIRWWGHDAPPRDAALGIGYVFQQPTLMPWARIAANVRLPLDLAGQPREAANAAARAALARVGLGGFEQAWPRELSGGMRMRASIARALVTKPALLLLDEPFAALDEFSRQRMDDDLVAWWRSSGLTAMFVTHSIAEAVYLATRVVVMAARPGRIVDEVAIDLPHPRGNAWRGSPEFARHCVALSETVARAAHAGESP